MDVREVRLGGEEAARRQLAWILHDDHSQRVTALGFELQSIRNALGGDDPQRPRLDGLASQLSTLGNDLRRLSHDLHPAVLEQKGLYAALLHTCAEMEQRHGLIAKLDGSGIQQPIPPDVALSLYRIAREALLNAARHGQARTVHLNLQVGSIVRLTLRDDGQGFDPAVARTSGGLGLTTMVERARLLGGRCTVTSSPGNGTTVTASIPRRKLGRWLRLRRRWVMAVSLIVLTLGIGLATTYSQARRAAAEAHRSDAVVQFLEDLFASADPRRAPGEPLDARELLRRGSARLDTELADEPLLRAQLLDTLGGIYTTLGLYDEARPRLDEALALRQQLLGEAHPEVAATLTRLGSLAHLSGQGDAVQLFHRALSIRQARPDRPNEDLIDLLNKLGVALGAEGRLDEAETALYRCLELQEQLQGPQSLQVAKTLHNLSGVAYYRGAHDTAIGLVERSLAIRKRLLAEDDLELAGSREAMALMLQRKGRPDEAAELLEALTATVERVYGPDHPEVARVAYNLGSVYADLGEVASARALWERALSIEERTLAPDQRMLVRTLVALAQQHLSQGRNQEAEVLYRRLLELHDQGADYDSWDSVLAQWEQLQATRGAH